MSDEVQKAVIFRAPGDNMSDMDLTLPKPPIEPEVIEADKDEAYTDGYVLVSVYFPSMHALDVGQLVIQTYYFGDKKEAEKRKRKILKRNQEDPPPGMQILRIRPLLRADGEYLEYTLE